MTAAAGYQRKKTVAHHCEKNILYIPTALYGMRDVRPMLSSLYAAIFYKELEQDLVDIEFHTGTPCLVYIKTGQEVITTSDNEIFTLSENDAIFLPKGLNLYSDYRNNQGPLNAYLVFFSDMVITDFLATGTVIGPPFPNQKTIFKIQRNQVLMSFFQSLYEVYPLLDNSPQLLNLKLLELLHLIDIHDPEKQLRLSLSLQQQTAPRSSSKRNIKRLMEKHAISKLTAKDFAALSGRSLSCFNREFKQLYGKTPKQWLVEQRLAYAHMLLVDKQWSVTATANEVGYENVSHFIAAFKKMYRSTPHQIKKHID